MRLSPTKRDRRPTSPRRSNSSQLPLRSKIDDRPDADETEAMVFQLFGDLSGLRIQTIEISLRLQLLNVRFRVLGMDSSAGLPSRAGCGRFRGDISEIPLLSRTRLGDGDSARISGARGEHEPSYLTTPGYGTLS